MFAPYSLFLFLLVALFVKSQPVPEVKSGAILSVLTYYLGQEQYEIDLVSTDYESGFFSILQNYIPGSVKGTSDLNFFTTFNNASRVFTTVITDYPRVATCTFFTSSINNDANASTPLITNLLVKYPVSLSPAPLNDAHLVMSRILLDNVGNMFAVFSNGEVHTVDLTTGTFTFSYKLIPDSNQLSANFPYASWGHVYDTDNNVMWSVLWSGNNWYSCMSSLSTKIVSNWTLMAMPQGDKSGFSPETLINMHYLKLQASKPAYIVVLLESLDNVGFDQVNYLNTRTGQLEYLESNLMSDGIVFECNTNMNDCDKWRVSAYDPVYNRLYFQGHSPTGEVHLNVMGFSTNVNTGALNWYTNILESIWFGYSGFQWVGFL